MKRVKDKLDLYGEAKVFKKENFVIYFKPSIIAQYIQTVIKIQNGGGYDEFYPIDKNELATFMTSVDSNFIIKNLKYGESINLKSISKIVANYGISGYNLLENIPRVINTNKPLLLFYGIEQLSSYYTNLHLNFTEKNGEIPNEIKSKIRTHGISSHNFNDINPDISLGELIEKKIKLKKLGICSKFFIAFKKKVMTHFSNNIEISLKDLFINLFREKNSILEDNYESIVFPPKIIEKFYEQYGNNPTLDINSPMLTIYLISFLFSHLCRYKMDIWQKLLRNDKTIFSYYVSYFINYGRYYFLKILFNKIFNNERDFGIKTTPILPYIRSVYSKEDFYFSDYDNFF